MTGATDSLRLIGFNGFDAALCDALAGALAGFLLAPLADFLAVALVVFADAILADVLAGFLVVVLAVFPDLLTVLAPAGFPAGVFGGFLARFLGHTPSFRRFRRINHGGIAGLVRGCRNGSCGWANLMTPEYGDREFDASSGPSLNRLLGPDDE